MTTDLECQRCGTCCRAGGPALHREDRAIVKSGKIPLKDLYTIRQGELARDNVKGCLQPVSSELIKIKGKGRTWVCIYYDESSKDCGIYQDRPVECRELNCRDTFAIEAIYETERLARRDLIEGVPQVWDLVTEHEKRCACHILADFAGRAVDEKNQAAVEGIKKMVSYDIQLRAVILEKGGLDPALFDFLFGRPLAEILPGFGLQSQQKGGKLVIRPTGF
jgi:Fe-S-cluster containining protein